MMSSDERDSAFDTTGFTPLELWAANWLQTERQIQALEAERLPDGILVLTCWSNTEQANLMIFVIDHLDSVDQLVDLSNKCVGYCAEREASEMIQLVENGLSPERAAQTVTDWTYRLGLVTARPVLPQIREEYALGPVFDLPLQRVDLGGKLIR